MIWGTLDAFAQVVSAQPSQLGEWGSILRAFFNKLLSLAVCGIFIDWTKRDAVGERVIVGAFQGCHQQEVEQIKKIIEEEGRGQYDAALRNWMTYIINFTCVVSLNIAVCIVHWYITSTGNFKSITIAGNPSSSVLLRALNFSSANENSSCLRKKVLIRHQSISLFVKVHSAKCHTGINKWTDIFI